MKRLTNRVHVAVRLFSDRSQMTSKCGKKKKKNGESLTHLSFFQHFEVFCDLLLNRRTATCNLFVLYYEEKRNNILAVPFEDFYASFRHFLSHKRYFSSLLLLFFFILLVFSFSEKSLRLLLLKAK